MSVRRIIIARGKGRRALLNPCAEVVDRETLARVVKDLTDTLPSNAVGLAAPQIGEPWRVFVMRDGEKVLTFVNPVVLQTGPNTEIDSEGCLSMPGHVARVRRPTWIRVVKSQMPGTATAFATAEGRAARIILHEIDHLDGVLMSMREAQG
jgi:peptide deformylase